MTKRMMWMLMTLAALIFGLGACGGGGGGGGGGDTDGGGEVELLPTLPGTGQTKCYDELGIEIACAGTGQDGESGVNPLSFTDNGDGTVTDNVTDLIWQRADDNTPRIWNDAVAYCDNNDAGLPGSDWRLPTRRELMHIVDYGRNNPAIFDPTIIFIAESSSYWSASSRAITPTEAWHVDFDEGYVSSASKIDTYRVRCVQGDSQPDPVYVDNVDGTVTNEATGLIWQKADDGNTYTWQGALNYCDNNTAGLPGSGWRLPNIKELESIVDDSVVDPTSDPVFSARSFPYWSASSLTSAPANAWVANFFNGPVASINKTLNNGYVRCVR